MDWPIPSCFVPGAMAASFVVAVLTTTAIAGAAGTDGHLLRDDERQTKNRGGGGEAKPREDAARNGEDGRRVKSGAFPSKYARGNFRRDVRTAARHAGPGRRGRDDVRW